MPLFLFLLKHCSTINIHLKLRIRVVYWRKKCLRTVFTIEHLWWLLLSEAVARRLTLLCVLLLDPTWITAISDWCSTKDRAMKWSESRSSHRGCSVKRGVLRNLAKLTAKHLCQTLFFKSLWHCESLTVALLKTVQVCFPFVFWIIN